MKQIEDLIRRIQMNMETKRFASLGLTVDGAPRCKVCQDRGVILVGDVAKVCSCVKQRHLEQRFRYANITPEIKNCRFDSFRLDYYAGIHRERALSVLQGARQFVRDYLKDPHTPGILFTGDVGSGKTYLAGAITNELLQHDIQALFLVVPDFLDELRATYSRGNDGADVDDVSLLRTARQVDVLILDDLGVHNYTSWTCNKLYSLLNYRLNYKLPVIITTNLDLDEIEKFLGQRTTSRIVQMCRIYRLTVDVDIRRQKSLEKLNRY